ncbi:MAG: aldehyde dehydrogenase family protein [Planctomycetes bacterium]|nr:aldehyde dehydrogenase family protein [Planctomycetota bacterium]
MTRELLRIGGGLREGARLEAVTSPWSGEQVGEVAVGDARDMDDAVAAAARAFDETRRLPTHRRAAILEAAARALEARAADLARLMALESGKPITQCQAEVARGVITLSLGAVEARRAGGEVLPVDLEPRGEGRLCLATRVPRGPVAAISPFNFPLNLVAHKLSPAVAVGASVVLKPPPQCPLTAFALAALLDEAGLPAGALNVVHCPPDVAQRMVEDPRMKVVSFTGSDAVGWRLKEVAGKKQVLLELGGHAPCIVDEDADLERALPAIVAASFQNGGQVCIRIQRLLVHRARFDEVLGRFVEAARALPVGDPLDPRTVVGPLIEPRHVERVLAWVREAKEGGATVHCGGEALGQAVLPTVLTGAPRDARVCREEVFGPVTVVEPFDGFDEALARCNDTRFGLQAALFTRDLGKALRAHRELDYGGVIVNDAPTFRIDNFPYGGTKDSGFGREGVRYAMEELTEPRVLVLRG